MYLSFHVGNTQNTQIDSLKAIIQLGLQDTTQVAALNDLAIKSLQLEEIDQAKDYADQALELSIKLDFLKGKAYALKNKGLAEYYEGNYREVAINWNESLDVFEAIQDNIGIANLTNNLGVIYFDQGSYIKALDYYKRSLSFSEKAGDTIRITSALVNIGGVSSEMLDYDKALSYFRQVKKYLPQLNDTSIHAAYLMGLAEVYSKLDDPTTALTYYKEALEINKESYDQAYILTSMGWRRIKWETLKKQSII